MVRALKQVKIRGEIRTIVDYTTEMIQHEAFVGNQHHTGWLDSRIAAHVSVLPGLTHAACVSGLVIVVSCMSTRPQMQHHQQWQLVAYHNPDVHELKPLHQRLPNPYCSAQLRFGAYLCLYLLTAKPAVLSEKVFVG